MINNSANKNKCVYFDRKIEFSKNSHIEYFLIKLLIPIIFIVIERFVLSFITT